ncbi:hypothetical protein Mapa_013912 [Marchantia paleacea]|nr:hypothetical protein Mapa_013912 [Marchantia paleacea]
MQSGSHQLKLYASSRDDLSRGAADKIPGQSKTISNLNKCAPDTRNAAMKSTMGRGRQFRTSNLIFGCHQQLRLSATLYYSTVLTNLTLEPKF